MYGSLAPRLALVPKVLARNALRKGGHGADVAYPGHVSMIASFIIVYRLYSPLNLSLDLQNLPFDIINGNGRMFMLKYTLFCAVPFWLPWLNARWQINKA